MALKQPELRKPKRARPKPEPVGSPPRPAPRGPPRLPPLFPNSYAEPKPGSAPCNTLLADVRTLGKTIQTACANEPPEFTKEINKNLGRLEELVARLSRRLGESLAKASEAQDSAARKAELARSKAMMIETVRDVKPLAALIDSNPFMKTNFTAALTAGLTSVAQAITKGQAAA